jgi:predicted phosphodiesterase
MASIKYKLAKECIDKFPEAPTNQLARKLYNENKKVFKDKEDARGAIRYYRGEHGNKHRKKLGEDFVKPEKVNLYNLPEEQNDNWKPKPFPLKKGRGSIMADLHIPYHDNEVITIILDWTKKNKFTDFILLNGDIQDCYMLSKFEKDPRQRSFTHELDDVNLFLDTLQKTFPETLIVYKRGNHDYRLDRYLRAKAPEIFDLREFIWHKYLRMEERGIIVVEHDIPITVGKLNIIHGHELRGTSTVVNPARGAYLKAVECILEAHWHRTSQHAETSFSGRLDTSWSIGCACNLHPQYARLNKWNHGFAGLEIDGKDFEIYNKRIVKGLVR